ncbi:M56 family metallopeptidase [Streptomyces flavidovirens]|uniref:M56 family metallopeptidase n=1 Tax=Streptomyces flavidovirens TaxID=67298 RepID=A0ABW6RIC4_9ACTN
MISASAVVTAAKWPYRAPCAALSLWLAGALAALTGLLLATYGVVADVDSALDHRKLRLPVDALAIVGAWAYVIHVLISFIKINRAARRRRERHVALLELFARPTLHLAAVVLPSRHPVAYSVPGPHGGHAVVSEAVLTNFSREEVASVLAHEEAHLRQRHHLFTQLVDALGSALPKRHFAVRFAERFSGLIEMRADCASRHKCGRHAAASALARMVPDSSDEPASGCPVAARRRHLLFNDRCCNSLTSSAVYIVACSLAAAPVVLTAAGLLAAACNWICR